MSVYYVLHIPDEKKTKEIESTSSRNSQSTKRHPGQHILQITDDTTHMENMESSLSSFISWVFREGFPKEASSDLSFEIKIGVWEVLLRNTSNTGIFLCTILPIKLRILREESVSFYICNPHFCIWT